MRHMIVKEHAVVLDHMVQETKKDPQLGNMGNVRSRIRNNDWDIHKNNPEIAPFYHIRYELYEAEDLS